MILTTALVSTLAFSGCNDTKALHSKVSPSVVRIEVTDKLGTGHGTGLLVDNKGTVVTSTHVIEGAISMRIVTNKGRKYDYALKTMGHPTSLSSIRPITTHPTSYISASTTIPDVGDPFVIIGNPYDIGFFYATGMVSKVVNKGRLVLSNMKSHPGFSGGFAFDCSGRPIGSIYGAYGSPGVTIMNGMVDIERYKLLK
jgi:S1-C subfamily serine protease